MARATKTRSLKPRSLLARGVDYLSRREHSRLELYRKLMQHINEGETADDVEKVLDTLEAKGYLSNARYAENRVRLRLSRYGDRRLKEELRMAGVAAEAIDAALTDVPDELTRARDVWTRRFKGPAKDDKEREKQIRFLASRGFFYDVISKIVKDVSFE